MLETLIHTIELFECCSGQRLNWEKSAVCGINVDDSKMQAVSSHLNCKIESYLFFILDFLLPFGATLRSQLLALIPLQDPKAA